MVSFNTIIIIIVCFCETSEVETSNSFANVPRVFFSATCNR